MISRGLLGALTVLAMAGAPAAPVSGDTLQTLIDRLGSSDASERAEAACALGQRGPAAVSGVDELTALLSDSLRVGPIECGMSPWLKKLIASKPEEWRKFETSPGREAAKALARIGEPALEPLLATLSSSTSPAARANAAFCANTAPGIGLLVLDAGSFGDPGAIRQVLRLTGDFAVDAVAAGSPAERAVPSLNTCRAAVNPCNRWPVRSLGHPRKELSDADQCGFERDAQALRARLSRRLSRA